MKRYIETHTHLDYLKDISFRQEIEEAQKLGVERVITVAVSPENQQTVLDIANEFDGVYCTQGIHPHQAKEWNDNVEQIIITNIKTSKVVALGEIGLDYHYDKSPRTLQRQVFERQLQIAIESELPVVIHSREAEEDTMDIMKNYISKLRRKGVFHSFTSKKFLAEFALENDFYLGFNGIITFKNAHEVREIVEFTPSDKILIETDAPFLAPVPYRGRENRTSYLPVVGDTIVKIKGEEIIDQIYRNSLDLFFV